MEYFRVKPEYDQRPTNRGILVANELYTFKEWQKLRDSAGRKLPMVCFDTVEISKNDTCFFFGARFSYAKLDKKWGALGYHIERTATGHPVNKYAVWFRGDYVGSCPTPEEGNKLSADHNKNRSI